MYPDAYEVGVPNQGVQILYEVLNEQPDVLAERTYAVWPDLEALMREHGVPQFTVDAHRPVGAFDLLGAELLHRARLHQHAHRARPRRASRCTRATATSPTRSWSPAATPRSTPSRSPTSSTPRSSATASRPCSRSPRSCAPGRPRAAPAAARSCCCASRAPAASTSRVLRRRLPPRRSHPARRAEPPRRPVAGLQAHRHGPRRVALPEAAAGAARRERARADERRDLPRLHPRLPLLPGRHDHPPGARAQRSHASARWSTTAWRRRATRRSACSASRAPTTARSPSWPRASPTATRAPRPACRCRAPASTRSTSTSPTSSPATAVAAASRSRPRAAASGCARSSTRW